MPLLFERIPAPRMRECGRRATMAQSWRTPQILLPSFQCLGELFAFFRLYADSLPTWWSTGFFDAGFRFFWNYQLSVSPFEIVLVAVPFKIRIIANEHHERILQEIRNPVSGEKFSRHPRGQIDATD